jgi:hypothetical protein
MTSRNNSEERLRSTEEECERLRAENTRLRAMLGIRNSTSGEYSQTNHPADVVPENRSDGPPAPEKKIALFRSLFRRMHMPFVGREGMAGMAILPPVPWTGAQSMPRGQRIERKSHGRRECFTRSQMTPFAITSLESKPSVSTRFCPTRLVGSSQLISTRSAGWPMPQRLQRRVDGSKFQ